MSGTAAILNFGYLELIYELEDLSHMGARLRGIQGLPQGSFEILLRVAGHFWERRARLVWDNRGDTGTQGIEFIGQNAIRSLDWSPSPYVSSSQDEAWASQQLTRCALVILDHESRQSPALFQSILALGLAPIVVSTPLEAITVMERSKSQVEIVFMTEGLSGCRRGELARFVTETYPRVRLVLLEDSVTCRARFLGAKVARKSWSLDLRGAGLTRNVDGYTPQSEQAG